MNLFDLIPDLLKGVYPPCGQGQAISFSTQFVSQRLADS
jgi:hypothetical protein